MPSSTFSFFLLAAAAGIYAIFSHESKDDDEEQQSPPRPSFPPSVSNSRSQSTFTSSDHQHHYSSCTPTTHTVKPPTAQAIAKNLESSHHVNPHGLALSSRTVPTSAAQAQIPYPTQSTASRVRQTASTTSDLLDPLHCTSLTSSEARDSRLTHTSYATQQTSPRGAETTARTPSRTDYDNSLHRSDFASSSSVWESYQTTPTRTPAPYPAQQTSARVSKTTSRTPTTTDYDSSFLRSDFASPSVWESRQTLFTPTRTHALYSTQQTSIRVPGTPVRTPTMAADYDDMEPSPYSYLRTPSPDTSRTRVSRLTVSPQKHSRTQSSSSDSDYLGPSSRTRVVPRSQSHEVNDAIANADAKDRKKAMELRDQAKRSARDMLDARDRAKDAHRKGDYEAEDEYGQEARSHESLKKNSDKRAAKLFFRVNNKVHEEGTVDLHNLYVAEAVEYAKEELQSAIYRSDDTVTFIVGQGRHSEDGVPKLRPALEELFNERRLRHSLDPGNAGKLIVYLD